MVGSSLLTPKYRDIVKNNPEPSDAVRTNRYKMRKRVVQGLHDMALLNQYARDDDIKQIFERKRNDADDNRTQDYTQLKKDPIHESHWVPARHIVALLWQGLRSNNMTQAEVFEKVIIAGIEKGEAQYRGASDRGIVESDISLNSLEIHWDKDKMDPLEKFRRELGLSGSDIRELSERVEEHPDVSTISELKDQTDME